MICYFHYDRTIEYPEKPPYSPESKYKEYPFEECEEETNKIYAAIREIFLRCGMDEENYDKQNWNPLEKYIKPGDTVLLKPNMVCHENKKDKTKQGLDCLITHPSIVRAIFDYVYIALHGQGKIIIADAPVQGCVLDKLLKDSGYLELINYCVGLSTKELEIVFSDLRETIFVTDKDSLRQVKNPSCGFEGQVVDIGKDSLFYHTKRSSRLRVTGYNAFDTTKHHRGRKHEYCISKALLEADVVISLPKPKSHRIAGYTGALKNYIGINTSKEYLPHHSKGRKGKEGDEYQNSHVMMKSIDSFAHDFLNWSIKHEIIIFQKISNYLSYRAEKKLQSSEPNSNRYGMWFGNDTLWRTILDIYYIVKYCDKEGKMKNRTQRKCLYIGDMIVSGEEEGPLSPTYKKVGGLLFSDDAIAFDLALTRLMGYDYSVFRTLENAVLDKRFFLQSINDVMLKSNISKFNKKIQEINDNFYFKLSSGWKSIEDKRIKNENSNT